MHSVSTSPVTYSSVGKKSPRTNVARPALSPKARALARRRYHVSYEDVTSVVAPVLRHRLLLNFHAESDRIEPDEILARLIAHVPRPRQE